MKSRGYKAIGVEVDGKQYRVWYRRHPTADGVLHECVYKQTAIHRDSFPKAEAAVIKVIRESL